MRIGLNGSSCLLRTPMIPQTAIVHVRHLTGEAQLQLRFSLFNKDRKFNRSVNEPLSKVMTRIQLLQQQQQQQVQAKNAKKKKKKKIVI